jgi:NAD(P)H-hydrate epimerase
MLKKFTDENLKDLWSPKEDSRGEDNGQVVIVGGSELFTGAPLLSLVAASRLVDMVFLATPDTDREAAEKAVLFSRLKSVIWVPQGEIGDYIEKADAALIGPGMMRYRRENSKFNLQNSKELDVSGTETRMLTQYLLTQFPEKRWVVDGGSLQVIEPKWLPGGSVITPNSHEYQMLFGEEFSVESLEENARKYSFVICFKGPKTYVSDGELTYEVTGGNAGLTKGGTGDVLAGVVVGLATKNEPLLAATGASWVVKRTADELYRKVGWHYNADDLSEEISKVWWELTGARDGR